MNSDLIDETNWGYPADIRSLGIQFDESRDVARRIEQLIHFTNGPEKVLVIVAGLPGSGKSTFCEDLGLILEDDIETWVSHTDQAKYFSDYGLPIRAEQLENARRWTLQKLERSFQERVGVVLLECINLTYNEFQAYIDAAWAYHIPSLCVHFVCDNKEEAEEMAERASWRVPFNVLRDWYRAYEYPFGSPGQGVIPIAARGLN